MTRPLVVRMERIVSKVDELIAERDAAIAAKEAAEQKVAILMAPHRSYDAIAAERDRLSAELAEAKRELETEANAWRQSVQRLQADRQNALSAAVARADALQHDVDELGDELAWSRSLLGDVERMRPVVKAARALLMVQNRNTWADMSDALRALDASQAKKTSAPPCVGMGSVFADTAAVAPGGEDTGQSCCPKCGETERAAMARAMRFLIDHPEFNANDTDLRELADRIESGEVTVE